MEPLATLQAELTAAATVAGLSLAPGAEGHLEGQVEAIRAKWFLGRRTVRYRFACDLDETTQTATFREAMLEKVTGMAPPTFSVEKTTQKGTRAEIERKDVSVGGGGAVSYGDLRQEFERVVIAAGWRFDFQPLRAP